MKIPMNAEKTQTSNSAPDFETKTEIFVVFSDWREELDFSKGQKSKNDPTSSGVWISPSTSDDKLISVLRQTPLINNSASSHQLGRMHLKASCQRFILKHTLDTCCCPSSDCSFVMETHTLQFKTLRETKKHISKNPLRHIVIVSKYITQNR